MKRFIKSVGKGAARRSCPRWASRPTSPIAARRSSTRSACKTEFVAKLFHRHRDSAIEGVGLAEIARGDRAPPSRRLRRRAGLSRPRSMSAANMPTACAARTMPGRRENVVAAAARGARQRQGRVQVSDFATRSSTSSPSGFSTIRGLFRVKIGRGRRPQAGAARGGRSAAGRYRQALLHRRHVASARSSREAHTTLAIAMNRIGGKSNTGEGGEEAGALQAAAERRLHALGDQAGRLGPLRRDDGVSRQLGHDADQDGAGRQARRRRPAARPQGRCHHRQGAPLDAGRRPDLAAAAPTTSIRSRTCAQLIFDLEERQPGRRSSR